VRQRTLDKGRPNQFRNSQHTENESHLRSSARRIACACAPHRILGSDAALTRHRLDGRRL